QTQQLSLRRRGGGRQASGTDLTNAARAPPETAAGTHEQVDETAWRPPTNLNRQFGDQKEGLCGLRRQPTGGSERPPGWKFQRLIALIVYRMVPAGALTVTVSPRRLPRSARPTGDSLLIRSRRGSASGDPTMV